VIRRSRQIKSVLKVWSGIEDLQDISDTRGPESCLEILVDLNSNILRYE